MLSLRFSAGDIGGVSPGVWPPAHPREPLPPNPSPTAIQPGPPAASCWTIKGDYIKTPPTRVPAGPDRRWHRSNVIGVSVPGLTEGGNDKDQSVTITWDWPHYSPAGMKRSVDYFVDVCGYTHGLLSRPQAINHFLDQGKSFEEAERLALPEVIRTARYMQARGMFVILVAVSDGFAFSTAVPFLEALLAAGALVEHKDIVCCCWQMDKWYRNPVDGVQLIKDNGAWSHPHGLLTTVHWGGGYEGWAASFAMWSEDTERLWGIHGRASFQRALLDDLDGHYGQCNTEAPIDEVQSWLRKGLVAMPEPMFCVAAELDMQARSGYPNDPEGVWSGPKKRLEIYGDQKGLLATYADPNGRISYLNGARQPDGRAW